MPNPTKIRDCMHRKPLTIRRDESLVTAISMIVEYKLTGLTVTDSEGAVVGILSELDCIRAVLTAIYNDGDPEHKQVEDAMDADVQTCTTETSIVEVAQAMVDTRQRRRPVVEAGKLVGQVSSNNVLWALMEHSRRKVLDQRGG
ncbi:CBS domain-containing protein [Parahaliea mediterranea]|uniref:CBS domain-containing protein n=1 Tax=Parahaliea mediterranea TaxID=651086 RepID=UPI001F4E7A17|nr:CBS domain-containing protein [Parahaliea mediterranea]